MKIEISDCEFHLNDLLRFQFRLFDNRMVRNGSREKLQPDSDWILRKTSSQ